MLNTMRRKSINSWETEYTKIGDDSSNKTIFEIVLVNKTKCSINIVGGTKIQSIVHGAPLDDYLSNFVDVHKIIIAKDVQKKVVKQINSEYKNAEFFFEDEIMEDISSKVFMSVHQIMDKDERSELLSKFAENDFAKIHSTDPMARYIGAVPGDIIKITRPSTTAGKNIFYRKVIVGSWDNLFKKINR